MSPSQRWLALLAICTLLVAGCKLDGEEGKKLFDRAPKVNYEALDSFRGPGIPAEAPSGINPTHTANAYDMAPLDDFKFGQPGHYRMMSLEECILSALQSSPVIRELGGATLRSPDQVATVHDPALAYSDPRIGEEAALSAFDAQLNSQFIFQNNDRAFNNRFLGDDGFLQQNLASYRTGISKLAATGAQFEFNHVVDYDLNNSPSNRFNPALPANQRSHSYDLFFEAGFRQPLLQGAGVDYNRIAGPNNAPGVNNGVLIARTNTDIELAEFETQLRNLVSDVENAYWDLYYAYRDLESRIEARDGAYKIWQAADANEESDAAVINQAKEQYYRFAANVENAIHGRLNEGTRTNNGSSGGTFRNNGGVRTSERRLRLITGLELNQAQLIVPSDRPTEASIVFEWQQSKTDALVYRPELRRQRWQVKRRELELIASRNHLQPRVDLLGKYRVRGFGENLFGEQGFNQPLDVVSGSSATASLLDGDLQEWELGIDVNVPIGYRQQHAAYRNAELGVARETSILREQERQVIYGLSNAMGELKRAYRVKDANMNRVEAATAQYNAIKVVYEDENRNIDQLLDAQRRVIEAKTQYYQSEVEYMLALRSVHFEKGTLFRYHNMSMTETPWAEDAHEQAKQRDQWKRRKLDYYFPGLQIGECIKRPENADCETCPDGAVPLAQDFPAGETIAAPYETAPYNTGVIEGPFNAPLPNGMAPPVYEGFSAPQLNQPMGQPINTGAPVIDMAPSTMDGGNVPPAPGFQPTINQPLSQRRQISMPPVSSRVPMPQSVNQNQSVPPIGKANSAVPVTGFSSRSNFGTATQRVTDQTPTTSPASVHLNPATKQSLNQPQELQTPAASPTQSRPGFQSSRPQQPISIPLTPPTQPSAKSSPVKKSAASTSLAKQTALPKASGSTRRPATGTNSTPQAGQRLPAPPRVAKAMPQVAPKNLSGSSNRRPATSSASATSSPSATSSERLNDLSRAIQMVTQKTKQIGSDIQSNSKTIPLEAPSVADSLDVLENAVHFSERPKQGQSSRR